MNIAQILMDLQLALNKAESQMAYAKTIYHDDPNNVINMDQYEEVKNRVMEARKALFEADTNNKKRSLNDARNAMEVGFVARQAQELCDKIDDEAPKYGMKVYTSFTPPTYGIEYGTVSVSVEGYGLSRMLALVYPYYNIELWRDEFPEKDENDLTTELTYITGINADDPDDIQYIAQELLDYVGYYNAGS